MSDISIARSIWSANYTCSSRRDFVLDGVTGTDGRTGGRRDETPRCSRQVPGPGYLLSTRSQGWFRQRRRQRNKNAHNLSTERVNANRDRRAVSVSGWFRIRYHIASDAFNQAYNTSPHIKGGLEKTARGFARDKFLIVRRRIALFAPKCLQRVFSKPVSAKLMDPINGWNILCWIAGNS